MTFRSAGPTAWLLVAGFVICAAINLPGHLSYDSIVQLNEGRRGFYANWHPPMMSWILGVFDWVWPGTALFTIFDMALFFGSLGAVFYLTPGKGIAATAVLALCLLTPQILLYEGIVWKDVLFANLAVAGFVALAVAGERWEHRRLRLSLTALAFLFFSVATLVRQNGGIVLPAGVVALAWIAVAANAREENPRGFALWILRARRFRGSRRRHAFGSGVAHSRRFKPRPRLPSARILRPDRRGEDRSAFSIHLFRG